MSDTPDRPGDPIPRVERLADDRGDRIRVVAKGWMSFARTDHGSILTQRQEGRHDLFAAVGQNAETIRVSSAIHAPGSAGWFIHGGNAVYVESELVERDLTDDEVAWCEGSPFYHANGLPESVVEFTIPSPERIRTAVLGDSVDAYPRFESRLADAARHDIVRSLQEAIERENLRQTKLSRGGLPIDLDPEWDPENDHNDKRDRASLYDMVSMRSDSHLVDFRSVTGFDYAAFKAARQRVLGIHEPLFRDHQRPVALDVAGEPEWTYCRRCGVVAPPEVFIQPQVRHRDGGRTLRVCEDCAERDRQFTDDAVAAAQDRRATESGGQRRIGGTYE